MAHFQNIQSLVELKKQYRVLALANHPDRGGSTETMQQINAEFGKLFKIWEHDTTASAKTTGYENDYSGYSANEYAERVYNEYRWTGSRYKSGLYAPKVVPLIRTWLKETYPDYIFSVRRDGYNSIYINLIKADFEAFTPEAKNKVCASINQYHLDKDTDLTDRAKDVMGNVISYANSYNFDNSDPMTDYFHTNFYLSVGIGDSSHPYKIEIPKSRRTKGETVPQFKHPEGAAHKAIRLALGKARLASYESSRYGSRVVLGEDHYYGVSDDNAHFYPLDYSSAKTAQKRMDKLIVAGIQCKLSGCNGGYIIFQGYTPETEAALERERNEVVRAMQLWKIKQAS